MAAFGDVVAVVSIIRAAAVPHEPGSPCVTTQLRFYAMRTHRLIVHHGEHSAQMRFSAFVASDFEVQTIVHATAEVEALLRPEYRASVDEFCRETLREEVWYADKQS